MSELGRDAKELVDETRLGDDPTPRDRDRIRAGLVAALGASFAASAAAAATTPAAATATAGGAAAAASAGTAKTVLLVVLGLCAALGGTTAAVLLLRSERNDGGAPRSPASPTSTTAPVPHAPDRVEAPRPEPAATGRASGDQPTAEHETPAPTPARPTVAATAPARRRPRPQVAATPDPPRAAPAAPSSPAPTLEAEVALLRDAQTALREHDATRAMRTLDEHRSRFAAGALSAERDATRVLVLCELARFEEARAAAAVFLREHGSSPLAARVRASCAGAGAGTTP